MYKVTDEDVRLNKKLLTELPFLASEYRDMAFGSLSPSAEYASNAYALTLGIWLQGRLPSVQMTEERLRDAFALCEDIERNESLECRNGIIDIGVLENILSAPVSSVRWYVRHMGPLMIDALLSMTMPQQYRSAIEQVSGRSGTSARVWLRDG